MTWFTLLFQVGLRYKGDDNAVGAQTGRRGGAGPVRGLLGGKDPTGRFCLPVSDRKGAAVLVPSAFWLLREGCLGPSRCRPGRCRAVDPQHSPSSRSLL